MKRGGAIIAIVLAGLLISIPAFAHPGNTAADGCHYCRTNCDYWGVPWNERHCHNSYTPEPAPSPSPKYVPPTQNTNQSSGIVAGEEDAIPKITRLSRSTLKPPKLSGQSTITVYGTDFSREDIFKLNSLTISRRYINSSKVRVTIPFSKLKYKTYTLRLYHDGVVVSSKKLAINKP